MRSEGYCSWFVCVSLSIYGYSGTTGYGATNEQYKWLKQYKRLQNDEILKIKMAIFQKWLHSELLLWRVASAEDKSSSIFLQKQSITAVCQKFIHANRKKTTYFLWFEHGELDSKINILSLFVWILHKWICQPGSLCCYMYVI